MELRRNIAPRCLLQACNAQQQKNKKVMLLFVAQHYRRRRLPEQTPRAS